MQYFLKHSAVRSATLRVVHLHLPAPMFLISQSQRQSQSQSLNQSQSSHSQSQSQNWRKFSSTSTTPTFNSSIKVLKLSGGFTDKELRDAYFTAAKLCHPDLNKTKSSEELSERFLKITEAYECLQKRQQKQHQHQHHSNKNATETVNDNDENIDWDMYVSKTEEQAYRDACQEILGLDAEIVEESKRCSLFRDWLKGKTDAAFHWNNFFMLHGGLAPMLRKKKVLSVGTGPYEGRRRRRSNHTTSTNANRKRA